MFFQNNECSMWPETWNARFFSSWLIVAQLPFSRASASFSSVVFASADVGGVVLAVVQGHDLAGVMGLERARIVGQVG